MLFCVPSKNIVRNSQVRNRACVGTVGHSKADNIRDNFSTFASLEDPVHNLVKKKRTCQSDTRSPYGTSVGPLNMPRTICLISSSLSSYPLSQHSDLVVYELQETYIPNFRFRIEVSRFPVVDEIPSSADMDDGSPGLLCSFFHS